MGVNQEQYITTVANCFLRDTDLDAIVMKSKTLVNSNIAFNVQEQEIRGGEFNKLLYTYNFGRTGEITLEDARYEPALVAINCGQTIQNQASNVYVFEEEVTLDAGGNGSVTLKTPIAGTKAYVQTSTGNIVTKSFTGSNFAMGGGYANQKVKVTYQYNETVDMITIDGTSFPKAYELVLEVKVFDAGGLKEKVQWIFPQFKPSGNFEMPLASESPSTSSMTGKILATSDDIYGYKKVIPVSSSVTYTAITADVAEVALETGETYALAVYGLRGGLYAPVTFAATDCTYASSDTNVATVNANGVISFAGAGTAYITVTHTASSLTDVVEVTCS
jgi:hypothetical protein